MPGVSLSEAQPISEMYRVGDDRFLYTAFTGTERGELLLLLDLSSGSTSEVDVRGIEVSLILGAAPGIAVVTDREQVQRFGDARLEFIYLERDAERIRHVALGAIDPTCRAVVPAHRVDRKLSAAHPSRRQRDARL